MLKLTITQDNPVSLDWIPNTLTDSTEDDEE